MSSEIAAFFRVEGALISRPTLAAAGYLIANSQALTDRFTRLTGIAMALPLSFGGPLKDSTLASRFSWMGTRGMSDDRLSVLGEEYATRYVIPTLKEVGVKLLDEARRRNERVVLVSDNLDVIMQPVAKHLGVADLVCNHLEMSNGKATGRLADPVISGHLGGAWAREYATENGFDLTRSSVYGASSDDALLMSAIGKPCAVTPDRALRRLARDNDWPVVEAG
ncbi:MAG: haloacid dehalogenase-like hydrolase [Sandaracinaceae bacterium]|nr:haloacid dehalogenase-like hydrolase [Sandaracinaceae bacterium]